MVLRNSGRVGSRRFRGSPRVRNDEGAFAFGNLINFCYICVELILYQRLKQIESMKIKVLLLAAVAVAFSFVVTSCGNKKAADSNATEVDSCCAAKTEQVCDSAKRHVARELIQQYVLRLHVMVPSVTNLVRRSNSELVLN